MAWGNMGVGYGEVTVGGSRLARARGVWNGPGLATTLLQGFRPAICATDQAQGGDGCIKACMHLACSCNPSGSKVQQVLVSMSQSSMSLPRHTCPF
jgi:hypothetical protein